MRMITSRSNQDETISILTCFQFQLRSNLKQSQTIRILTRLFTGNTKTDDSYSTNSLHDYTSSTLDNVKHIVSHILQETFTPI